MPTGIYKRTEKHRQKISAGLTGRKHSEKTKEKMRHAKTGKKFTLESRKKMSESRKAFFRNGGVHPKGMLGKHQTKEHRAKISKANSVQKNPNWKGGITSAKGGYLRVRIEKGVYILQHRLVMEKHLGRKLTKEEVVHHIDGNRINNNIKNLMLMANQKEHREYHINHGKN